MRTSMALWCLCRLLLVAACGVRAGRLELALPAQELAAAGAEGIAVSIYVSAEATEIALDPCMQRAKWNYCESRHVTLWVDAECVATRARSDAALVVAADLPDVADQRVAVHLHLNRAASEPACIARAETGLMTATGDRSADAFALERDRAADRGATDTAFARARHSEHRERAPLRSRYLCSLAHAAGTVWAVYNDDGGAVQTAVVVQTDEAGEVFRTVPPAAAVLAILPSAGPFGV